MEINPAILKALEALPIQIYADGANRQGIIDLYSKPFIRGLTTNPTLMRRAGISDYEAFAKDILQHVTAKPISFEVFSDEFDEMHRQALKIASWQSNVYVKIPISNTKSESTVPLVRELVCEGVRVNVTAILTLKQVERLSAALDPRIPAVVSVFAGRAADTGVDPMPIMRACKSLLSLLPRTELLWASVREVLNVFHAMECGSHIVTVPHDILQKLVTMYAADLDQLSLETVQMFARDAAAAGYKI